MNHNTLRDLLNPCVSYSRFVPELEDAKDKIMKLLED